MGENGDQDRSGIGNNKGKQDWRWEVKEGCRCWKWKQEVRAVNGKQVWEAESGSTKGK
jgi:hypothetical protein